MTLNFGINMKQNQVEQIQQLDNIFIPTQKLKDILDCMKKIRELGVIRQHGSLPDCMFITGETGVGKTTFIEKYLDRNPRLEEVNDEGEKTVVPVLFCTLPKTKHPKPVVAELLTELGDPLQGTIGDVRILTRRFLDLVKETKVELIIIDEFQHAIETTNKNVIQEIGEWFKIFIDKAKIPIVFVGVPWAKPVLEINPQLKRRVRKNKFTLSNYTLESFKDFQMFLQKIEEALPIKPFQPIWQVEFAFKLFAISRGNISELMDGVIRPACVEAIYDHSDVVTLEHFIDAALENTDIDEGKNPLIMELDKVVALEQASDSSWNPSAKKMEDRVIGATYAKVKFSDLNMKQLLSKK